jgi:hypothetical protein
MNMGVGKAKDTTRCELSANDLINLQLATPSISTAGSKCVEDRHGGGGEQRSGGGKNKPIDVTEIDVASRMGGTCSLRDLFCPASSLHDFALTGKVADSP